MEKESLKISFFGGFSIENRNYKLDANTNTSAQTTLLLTQLLMNFGITVPKNVLINTIWPDDSQSNDLSGALRTLMYRVRQEMSKFFPDENYKFIKFTSNAYYWNTEIPCELDIAAFEKANALAKHESDSMTKYGLYHQMYDLYKGNFMPNYTYCEFISCRNVYFKNEFIHAVLYMCEYLFSLECFDEIISICDHSIIICPEEERLYAFKLKSYLSLDLPEQAMDYYNSVMNSFSHKLGLDITSSFTEIYNAILEKLPLTKLDINGLETTLQEPISEKTPFYCDFNMFKNFYQISKRSVRRSFSKRYLVLFTIVDEKNPSMISHDTEYAMKTMLQIICDGLRQNDVYTRTSDWQYSVIIMVPNENGAQLAIARLKSQFAKQNTCTTIHLNTTLKCIE